MPRRDALASRLRLIRSLIAKDWERLDPLSRDADDLSLACAALERVALRIERRRVASTVAAAIPATDLPN